MLLKCQHILHNEITSENSFIRGISAVFFLAYNYRLIHLYLSHGEAGGTTQDHMLPAEFTVQFNDH